MVQKYKTITIQRSPISKVIVKNVWLEIDTKIVAGLNWLLESS